MVSHSLKYYEIVQSRSAEGMNLSQLLLTSKFLLISHFSTEAKHHNRAGWGSSLPCFGLGSFSYFVLFNCKLCTETDHIYNMKVLL